MQYITIKEYPKIPIMGYSSAICINCCVAACFDIEKFPATLSIVAPYGEMSRSDRGATTNRDNHKFAACSAFLRCGSRKTVVNTASGHPSASHTFGSSP